MDVKQNREWTRMDANESVKTKTKRRFTQVIAGRSVQLRETLSIFRPRTRRSLTGFFAPESERQVEIHSQQLLNEL